MSKKSLITSVILGAILTLSLGVYTLVSAIVAMTTPHFDVVSVAYASKTLSSEGVWEDLKITDFSDYSVEAGTLEISYADENEFLEYDAESNTYSLKEGSFEGQTVGAKLNFTAVATTDKYGSTTTYNATVYNQGTGYDEYNNASKENAYLVTNADDMEAFERNSLREDNNLRKAYVMLVEDVDLAGKEWTGISSGDSPFVGTFDGNGYKVKNLTINITADNYENYLNKDGGASTDLYLLAGLFNRVANATISGLSVVDAKITVADEVLDLVKNYAKTVDSDTYRVVATCVGLVAGDAYRSTINGQYGREVTTLDEEQNEITETVYANSTVSGTINGVQFERSGREAGFGGLVGVLSDRVNIGDLEQSTLANYDNVNVNVNISGAHGYNFVGGIAGRMMGRLSGDVADTAHQIAVNNINVTLNGSANFFKQNYIGGVAGLAFNVNAKDIESVNVNLSDAANATISNLNAIISAEGFNSNDAHFTYAAGIAAYAEASQFEAINVNANISLWTKVSAGFGNLQSSQVKDVSVAGTITAFEASGLAFTANNSNISYTQDEFTAADVKLYAHNAAALVDFASNTNITGLADTVVKSEISAYGYNVTNAAKNNLVHSSGLVGYYYADGTGNTYVIEGFAVDTTINNGVDMAGVVTYLGSTDTTLSKVVIRNVAVDAKLNSYSTASYSTTHKAGGAVATVYGNATLENNTVAVAFNTNHQEGNKYGVAMFGGLVARVAGEDVAITGNTTSGSAYVNDSLYGKTFNDHTYKQITVGGLVGSIASFGTNVAAGSHPTYTEAADGFAIGDTYDKIELLDVSSITIEDNEAGVEIVVDYVDDYADQEGTTMMFAGGYLNRSAGTLVGLIRNAFKEDSTYSTIDLSTNTATGTLEADQNTYTYKSGTGYDISSMGYGRMTGTGAFVHTTPLMVGATYDLTGTGEYVSAWGLAE